MDYIKNPSLIETKSFEMIEDIINDTRPEYSFKNDLEKSIIKRAIHTTADFDYLDILKISDDATSAIINALKDKSTIYTDTNMALSGINKSKLKALGCEIKCYVADEEVAKLAKEKEITRSMAAVEFASMQKGRKIFVIGNAPTALYKIMQMIEDKTLNASAVIGVPVGFVGAAESKDELEKTNIPYILSKGRKGGSNLAAAILNAILYNM